MSDDTPQLRAPRGDDANPALHVRLEGFEESDELRRYADGLIAEHGRLRFLQAGWAVAYLLDHGEPSRNGKACAWGMARLVPKWARALTRYDAAITINATVWAVLSEVQRNALMLHELCHLGENPDSGKLETVPHDVEEFGFVVATYGQWRSSLELFSEQLALGLRDGRE